MPRVVFKDVGFQRIGSHSWREYEFEDLVLYRASTIFPRWHAVRFNPKVTASNGVTKQPDLALIDEHYREWWVVEVELEHHSLEGHVLPQIEVFVDGSYSELHANWLADRNPFLDRGRLAEMMLGQQPRVLVVVDSPSTNWDGPLRSAGSRLSVVEPFRNANDEYLLRINGFQPEPQGKILTRLERFAMLRRLWRVHSPAALPPGEAADLLEIAFEGRVSEWRRVRVGDGVFLQCERGDPLDGMQAVDLIAQEDGTLSVSASQRRRKAQL